MMNSGSYGYFTIQTAKWCFLTLFVGVTLMMLPGCNPCNPPKFCPPCRIMMRKPQVVATYSPTVWDYDVLDDPCCDNGCTCEHCCVNHCDQCAFGCCGRTFSQEHHVSKVLLDPYQPIEDEFQLSVGDVLEVTIFDDEETAAVPVTVAPDGYVYCMMLDGIPAAGRTVAEVSNAMRAQLYDLYLDPIVGVSPKEVRGQSYKVFGRVNAPGVYPILGPTRLREAIAGAGGLLMYSFDTEGVRYSMADLQSSYIVRDGKKMDIDFEKLLYSADSTHDIYLRPNDYIYIAPLETREVYVLGAVIDPQAVPYTSNLTVTTALATVGGWIVEGTPYNADIHRVLVIRGSLECPRCVQINLKKILNGEARDLFLKPGDILYVQNKQFRFGRELVRFAIESFIYGFTGTAAAHYAEQHIFTNPLKKDKSSRGKK